jgi:aryl-alcohol dehydrogenase-like predicted oxidoreductase
MEYRSLGRTGVSVSPLCLGTMMFGPWGNDDRADAIRVIHRALDAGINFVDTADVYSGGVSEEIVGEALQGRRDDVVLATKFFMPMDDRPNHGGGSRRWIIQEVEASLRRLKTDYIDLYQVHRPSPTTDVEETLGALTDLVRHRGRHPPDSAALRHGNPRVQPAVRWLAHRPVAQGRPRHPRISRTPERSVRHEHRGEPAQARRR